MVTEGHTSGWAPKTLLGKKVLAKEITHIDEILKAGLPILEPEIVDILLPNLKRETLEIKSTQRMTDCGRKAKFKVTVVVGDGQGHVGIGTGKAEEVRPAISAAERDAKKHLIPVPLGCGSWECGCGTEHTVPIAVIGRCGSVEVMLKPAPRGVGRATNDIVKKVLEMAGVHDAWSSTRGQSATIYNTAMATIDALDSLNRLKMQGSWQKEKKTEEMLPPQPHTTVQNASPAEGEKTPQPPEEDKKKTENAQEKDSRDAQKKGGAGKRHRSSEKKQGNKNKEA